MSKEENNKLIAEFMGFKTAYVDGNKPIILREFGVDEYISRWAEYHSSWDWLKPAIDKFLSTELNVDAKTYVELKKVKASLLNVTIAHPISDFYNELIAAIKWYNQQKK